MNLSARLDEARRRRAQGTGDEAKHPLDLRFAKEDGLHYEGREIRTGQPIDDETWRDRDTGSAATLPRWNPRRAGRVEPAPTAEVIDLTERTADRDEETIELPPWARDTDLYREPVTPVAPRDDTACVNCGGEPRVDVLDLLNGVALVECRSCGLRWEAPAGHFHDAT